MASILTKHLLVIEAYVRVRFDRDAWMSNFTSMKSASKMILITIACSVLSSCNAPLVNNLVSAPGRMIRGTAHAVGMGGVGGL